MSSLIPYDQQLLRQIQITFNEARPGGGAKYTVAPFNLPLQFPPKITKDERSAEIESKEMYQGEPFFIYKKYGARKLTMELVYIVEDYKEWSPGKIAGICKRLRGYFTLAGSDAGAADGLRVDINKLWLFGGHDNDGNYSNRPQRFIFKSVSISHSDTLITDRTKGYLSTFPLRTDISIDLWPVTNMPSAPADKDKKDKKDAKLPGNALALEWY
jgi:hypothetical protein